MMRSRRGPVFARCFRCIYRGQVHTGCVQLLNRCRRQGEYSSCREADGDHYFAGVPDAEGLEDPGRETSAVSCPGGGAARQRHDGRLAAPGTLIMQPLDVRGA